jgi:hypothetical protein
MKSRPHAARPQPKPLSLQEKLAQDKADLALWQKVAADPSLSPEAERGDNPLDVGHGEARGEGAGLSARARGGERGSAHTLFAAVSNRPGKPLFSCKLHAISFADVPRHMLQCAVFHGVRAG